MPKTFYYAKNKNHNLRIQFATEGVEVQFVGGKFETEDTRVQKLMEKNANVKNGHVVISNEDRPGPKASSVMKGINTTNTTPESQDNSAMDAMMNEMKAMKAQMAKLEAENKKLKEAPK